MGNAKFRSSVSRGDVEAVQRILNNKKFRPERLNEADEFGSTALHRACMRGHTEVVDLLLKAGADPNVERRDGTTPLHCAAMHGYQKVVELLILHNANLNVVDKRRMTPLMWAGYQQRSLVALMLILHGADTHFTDKAGKSVLETSRKVALFAMKVRAGEVLKMLIDINMVKDVGNIVCEYTGHRLPRGVKSFGSSQVEVKAEVLVGEEDEDSQNASDMDVDLDMQRMAADHVARVRTIRTVGVVDLDEPQYDTKGRTLFDEESD